MCLAEINRLHSHLIWLGTSALEIGAISMLWYAFREREKTVELSELVGGTRMHTRYFQAGGLAEDIPPGLLPVARDFCKQMSEGIDDYETILTATRSGWSGRRASGCSRPTTRSRSASRARCCARPGSTGTCAGSAVPRLRRGRLRRARLRRRRRLRPLPRAHGGDARSRCGSSASASTGSRRWKASRGSRTTARSCCRRGTSSTPRWSR